MSSCINHQLAAALLFGTATTTTTATTASTAPPHPQPPRFSFETCRDGFCNDCEIHHVPVDTCFPDPHHPIGWKFSCTKDQKGQLCGQMLWGEVGPKQGSCGKFHGLESAVCGECHSHRDPKTGDTKGYTVKCGREVHPPTYEFGCDANTCKNCVKAVGIPEDGTCFDSLRDNISAQWISTFPCPTTCSLEMYGDTVCSGTPVINDNVAADSCTPNLFGQHGSFRMVYDDHHEW